MVAYSFQPRFAPLVEAGTKRQTMRAPRRGPWGTDGHAKPGQMLQLYVGLRTRTPRLLRVTRCLSAETICIEARDRGDGTAVLQVWRSVPERAHGTVRSTIDIEVFAAADGFADAADMAAWWLTVRGFGTFDDYRLIGW